jgi:hypothetical protein
MPNGNKNNGTDEIELLPEELRRPEEKKKREEKPEIKLFVPEEEQKLQKPTFVGKFFSSKQKPPAIQKPPSEADTSVFKMQKEVKKNPPEIPSAPPTPKIQPPPLPRETPRQSFNKSIPPKTAVPSQPKVEMRRPSNGAQKPGQQKPSGEKIAGLKLGITLMPEEKISSERAWRPKQIIIIIVLAIILAVALGAAYILLKQYQGQADSDLQKVESDRGGLDQKIKALDAEKNQAQIFQKQLRAADELLTGHLYWTNFFSFLEKNTVADVYFVNMVGGSNGQIVLSGVAKNYMAIARQIVAFREIASISNVSILSASASVDSEGNITKVDFDAKLQINQDIFLKSSE